MKLVNKAIMIVILFLVLVFDISLLVLKKENYSYLENRYLSDFSISKIENYLNDHFPFRNQLLFLKNKIELLEGKTYINDVYVGKDNYLIPNFINNSKSHYIYESINDFSKDKSVYVMFVPDSILINEDKLYYHLDIEEGKELDYLYSNLKYSHNILLTDVLKEKNKDEEMYYKTDHHWTSFGAYYAYTEFMKAKNEPYLTKDQFVVKKISSDFMGTSSSKVLGHNIKDDIYSFYTFNDLEVNYVDENIITDTLYSDEYLNKKDKYSYFLGNNKREIIIHNKSNNNGKKILVIKNSYGNVFVPFLVNHYEYVHVIDLRYFNDSVTDYLNKNSINETLILYNMNNLYSDMSIVRLK